MLRLQDYWRDRSAGQRMALIAAFAITFLGIAGISWLAGRPSLAPLYSGLDPEQSGAIVSAIESAGVPHEVRGETIWVEKSRRDALRMTLASQGLPASAGTGYELLDGMSGFGTTSQMFDAAYWRAKEGELARTVLALPNVKAARVHLAVPSGRGFRRDTQASSSITITTNGTALTRAQAKALKYLVSSGVPGLSADHVTVIDSERGVVSTGEDAQAEDRAAEMKRNVERILEAHVGAGNAVVEVNLDVVTETETLTEQRYDPQQRALISQESEELADQSSNSMPGAVTAASNLPEGQQDDGDNSKSSRSETRQRSNFEVSKLTREVNRQPGSVRRLTVAVLVNGVGKPDESGTLQLVPREEADLTTIKELVASAVGYDQGRGDEITVKSMPFVSLAEAGTLAVQPGLLSGLDVNGLLRLALVGFFILACAGFLLRPVLRARQASAPQPQLDNSLPLEPAITAAGMSTPSLPATSAAIPEIDFDPASMADGDPVMRLKELMKSRKEESLKLLSGWIDTREDAL